MKSIGYAVRNGLAAMCLIWVSGCATMESQRDKSPHANDRLDRMLQHDRKAQHYGHDCRDIPNTGRVAVDCQAIDREVDRIYVEYPEQERVIMSNAVLQYRSGNFQNAQFLLDQLLDKQGAHPEAAILRAQIAMSEGNLKLAKTVLQREIRKSPDYAELHETLASVYFLSGKYGYSERELDRASMLGTPGWKTDYHRGLLYEAKGNMRMACKSYYDSIKQKSDYRKSRVRIMGLVNEPSCQTIIDSLHSSISVENQHQHR